MAWELGRERIVQDLSIRLANLKLDISDRKTKRFFKDLGSSGGSVS